MSLNSFSHLDVYSDCYIVLTLQPELTVIVMTYDINRWRPADLGDSRYVWLPLTVDGPADEPSDDDFEFPQWQRVSIHWFDKWSLPEGWDVLPHR